MFLSKISKHNIHKITSKDAVSLSESVFNIPQNIHYIKVCFQIVLNLFL